MKRTLMIAACVSLAGLANADKGDTIVTSALETQISVAGVANTTPTLNSSSFDEASGATTLNFDMTGQESWDGLGDPSNTVLGPGLPDGSSMTGVGWDITLTTVGGSWLSEATMNFNGLVYLTAGIGDDFAGTGAYASGGIIDLTDNGIPDILVAGDLAIELFEGFDDVDDAVDAVYGGSIDLVYEGGAAGVPTVSQWGLIILTVMLLLGVVAMSLKSKDQTVNA
ncbi:MAG: hypothetical protein ACI8QZ_003234 [Chlamydiales bacterium]|jgi:hypothetical protein